MTNDFSNIPAESNLRDEITVRPDEYDPSVEPMDPVDAAEESDELKMIRDEPDESMDGDFDSGMASAGFGTDEDYGYYGGDED